MRYAPIVISCGLAISTIAADISAQSAAADAVKQNVPAAVVRYVTAVIRHAPGRNDDSVDALAAWTRREHDEAFDALKLLLFGDPNAPPAFLERFSPNASLSINMLLKRAAMLHSDVAQFRRLSDGGYALPRDPAQPDHPIATDGRVVGTVIGTFHWEAARRVISLVRPSPGRDADVLLWYRTIAAMLQLGNDLYALTPHLAAARAMFPKDPVLLMYEGVIHENFADPRVQNAFRKDAPRPPRPSTCLALGCAPVAFGRVTLGSPAQEWHEAELLFDAALRMDPNLTEAHIRLGRVLSLQDRHDEAIAQLRKALDPGPSVAPVMRYFAWLLLGRELQTVGRGDDADRAFLQADALYPGSQEVKLGLSQTAQSRGDRAQALNHLGAIGAPRPADDPGDPWWAYDRIHSPSAQEQMALLVARLLR